MILFREYLKYTWFLVYGKTCPLWTCLCVTFKSFFKLFLSIFFLVLGNKARKYGITFNVTRTCRLLKIL